MDAENSAGGFMKKYYKKNLNHIVIFVVANILAAISTISLSFLLGEFADTAMSADFQRAWKLAIIAVVYLVVETFMNFALQYTRNVVTYRVSKNLRQDLVDKIEFLPYEEKQKKNDGDYLSLITNDVAAVEGGYLDSLGAIFFQICCFVISVGIAFSIQPVMTAIMLFVSALPTLFPKLTEKELRRRKEEEQQAKADYMTSVTQLLGGFMLLTVFRHFKQFNRKNDQANEALCEKNLAFNKMQNILYAGSYGCGNVVYIGTWILGLLFVTKGKLSLPSLITFSQLMTFVAGPIQIISERYAVLIGSRAIRDKLLQFIESPVPEKYHHQDTSLNEIAEVELKDMNYEVEDKKILDHVSLSLQKGDRVALIGESGSGKTTLMKVLANLYQGEGTYEINGREAREYSEESFGDKVVLLEQKSFIFNASIGDNITLFEENKDQKTILDTIRMSGLKKWFDKRGASLETPIDSEGRGLSGGEERRLELARILYHQAEFIMMDEPTTGLDAETRTAVEQIIGDLDCKILVVAMHNYSPEFLQKFNKVIRMEDGKMVELTSL
jgi:ABC-type multidrug transport system fused ATPase/permease subunit